MTKDEGLWVAVALVTVAVLLFYLFLRIKSLQQQIDKLNTRTHECVSETLFRLEQGNRRELERRFDAIQEHLGLTTVQQPSRTVVIKKGNAR